MQGPEGEQSKVTLSPLGVSLKLTSILRPITVPSCVFLPITFSLIKIQLD